MRTHRRLTMLRSPTMRVVTGVDPSMNGETANVIPCPKSEPDRSVPLRWHDWRTQHMCAAQLHTAQTRLPATDGLTVSRVGNGREPNRAWHQPAKPMKGRQDCQPARASSLTAKGANPSRQGLGASLTPAGPTNGWQGRKGFAAEISVESATQIMDAKMQPHSLPEPASHETTLTQPQPQPGVVHGRNLGNLPSPGDGPAAERQSTRPPLH